MIFTCEVSAWCTSHHAVAALLAGRTAVDRGEASAGAGLAYLGKVRKNTKRLPCLADGTFLRKAHAEPDVHKE